MEEIISYYLSPVLKEALDDEIINYVKNMQSGDDFDEFMENVIDGSNPESIHLCRRLKSVLFDTGAEYRNATSEGLKLENEGRNNNGNKGGTSDARHKKQKFISMDQHPNTAVLKKGRLPCDCEAKTHALINNCLMCGRIVCEQEGSGPCFFCDNMVGTREEMEILAGNSKVSDRLYNRLKEQKTSKEWKRAIENRDRLLNSDRNTASTSVIYDEDVDYYKLRDDPNYKADRKTINYILDLASKTVVTEPSEFDKHKGKLLKGVNKLLESSQNRFPQIFELEREVDYDEELVQRYKPKTAKEREEIDRITNPSRFSAANEAFAAELDKGMCLSMHQPWASLLIAGIKQLVPSSWEHEGRTWFSDHTGKLWIHAAGKEPEENDILAVEEMYRKYYNDPQLVFPKKYPTSCLLGRVTVEDCLPQPVYREQYPKGESDSPYVFICKNPQILPIFFSMPGQHKIFQLSRDMHQRAKDILIYSKKL